MRTLTALFLAALSFGLLTTAVAEEPGSAYAKAYCVTIHKDGDAACAAVEKAFMANIRKEFASKDVLFLTADVTSASTKHQAKMLLSALALEDVWTSHGNKPGTVILTDSDSGTVLGTFTSATKAAEIQGKLAKALTPPPVDEDEDEGDDG